MRILTAALAPLLLACATGPTDEPLIDPGVSAPTAGTPTGTGGQFRIRPDLVTASFDVPAGPEKAWPALLRVYEELKIPTPEIRESDFTVRNLRFVVSRRLAGKRLSTFLDCGRSPTGANADTHRLELEIASRVVPLGPEQSRIETEVEGTGQNMEGTSNTRVLCTSNHQLELLIAARVRELVGGAAF